MKIVVSGYYGYGNLGDEAILQATVGGLRRVLPGAGITILSSDPAGTARSTGAGAVPRYSPRAVWKALQPGGILLSGGGGLFQDTTSRRSLYYYLTILQLARWRRMRTMVYAQGVGPLRRRSSQAAVAAVLRRVDAITVRDDESAALLERIGVPGRAQVTADPVFALEPAPADRAMEILAAEGAPLDVPLLGIALRPWNAFGSAGRQALVESLTRAVDRWGVHMLFLGMQQPRDFEMGREIASQVARPATVLRAPCSPGEMAAILGRCRALVAMRLHALILAAPSGVPSVALSYDPKISALAAQLGGSAALDIQTLDPAALDGELARAMDAKGAERDRIRVAAETLRERAERNFQAVKELAAR